MFAMRLSDKKEYCGIPLCVRPKKSPTNQTHHGARFFDHEHQNLDPFPKRFSGLAQPQPGGFVRNCHASDRLIHVLFCRSPHDTEATNKETFSVYISLPLVCSNMRKLSKINENLRKLLCKTTILRHFSIQTCSRRDNLLN